MEDNSRAVRNLYAVDRVRCLECGTAYSKPGEGGTVQENPGCPRCGYLGWISASVPFSEEVVQHRHVADPQQDQRAQRG